MGLSNAWRFDDLVPAVEGRLVLGLLDNTYLAMRIAKESALFTEDDLDSYLRTLGRIMPDDVIEALDAKVDEAMTSAVSLAEQQGG